jgi:hypothetical protein
MRPIETLLILANLLTFIALVAPLPRAVLWFCYSALVALLIAGTRALVEGPRWQKAPAYALAGLFFLVWLLQTIAPAAAPAGQGWTSRPASGLAIGLGVLGLAVSIVLPIILPVFRFPPPTGPYGIGTLTYHWVDADRPEIFTADPGNRRELMVQIWYPAEKDPSSPRALHSRCRCLYVGVRSAIRCAGIPFKEPEIRHHERHPTRAGVGAHGER